MAPHAGQLSRFLVDEDANVTKGQVVAELAPADAQTQLYEAQAQYWRAEGNFKGTAARLSVHPNDPGPGDQHRDLQYRHRGVFNLQHQRNLGQRIREQFLCTDVHTFIAQCSDFEHDLL